MCADNIPSNYDSWPSPTVIELGRRLYEELVHADPTPGDLAWDDLPENERESYMHAATAVVRKFEDHIPSYFASPTALALAIRDALAADAPDAVVWPVELGPRILIDGQFDLTAVAKRLLSGGGEVAK